MAATRIEKAYARDAYRLADKAFIKNLKSYSTSAVPSAPRRCGRRRLGPAFCPGRGRGRHPRTRARVPGGRRALVALVSNVIDVRSAGAQRRGKIVGRGVVHHVIRVAHSAAGSPCASTLSIAAATVSARFQTGMTTETRCHRCPHTRLQAGVSLVTFAADTSPLAGRQRKAQGTPTTMMAR
jgi:hypothetical protein